MHAVDSSSTACGSCAPGDLAKALDGQQHGQGGGGGKVGHGSTRNLVGKLHNMHKCTMAGAQLQTEHNSAEFWRRHE